MASDGAAESTSPSPATSVITISGRPTAPHTPATVPMPMPELPEMMMCRPNSRRYSGMNERAWSTSSWFDSAAKSGRDCTSRSVCAASARSSGRSSRPHTSDAKNSVSRRVASGDSSVGRASSA